MSVAGLLLFMVGPRSTVRGPDVAPLGMVAVIEFGLQEFTVITLSFKTTRLFPWEAPKPDPNTDMSYPGSPDAGQMLLMAGGEDAAEETETLSIVAVTRVQLQESALDTAKPMYTFVAMLMACVSPTCVHAIPSAEIKEVNTLPARVTFIQYGKGVTELELVKDVLPPVADRHICSARGSMR